MLNARKFKHTACKICLLYISGRYVDCGLYVYLAAPQIHLDLQAFQIQRQAFICHLFHCLMSDQKNIIAHRSYTY